MRTRPEWQRVTEMRNDGSVDMRLRVPGGWLYEASRPSRGGFAIALCFVPLTGNQEEDSINDLTP